MIQPLFILILTVLLSLISLQAGTSIIALDSGEQVIGEVLPDSDANTVVLRSALLGEMKLPRSRVLSIEPASLESEPEPEPEAQASVKAEAVASESQRSSFLDKNLAVVLEELKLIDTFRDLKAPDSWSGDFRFGLNLSRGDSLWEETYARGKLEISPEDSPHFFRLDGSYTYRQSERNNGEIVVSNDQYNAQAIYRRDFWKNWFTQNSLAGRVDQIKGIDRELQGTLGVGYGYEPSDRLDIVVGLAGGAEDYRGDLGDTRTGLNPLGSIFQELTWRPLERTSFVQKFNYFWNPDNSEQYNYQVTAAIIVRLTDLIGFEFSYNESFDNDLGDGNAKDDIQWRNALVVYF